jgi:hypothetical protein
MGEGDRARRAHLQYLAHLARENNLERLDAETETRLNRLLAEENNLRAGIEWGAVHDPEMALEILAALGYFWMLADRPGPGRELHERILQTGAGKDRPERARVLQQAAWLIAYVGDSAPASPLADAARALADRLGERRTSAHAQMCQGSIAQIQGDARSARVLLSGALAAFEALQDDWGAIVCLTEIGIAALDWGELETALTAFARVDAIVAARHLTARYRAHSLLNLAEVNFRLGHPDVARQACTEALALMPTVARPRSVQAGVQLIVAHLLLEDGDPPRAAERIASSLGVFWEMGDWWNTAQALEAAGAAMTVGERFAHAARCFAAADALRLAMPLPIGASQEAIVARHTAAVRARLDPAAFSGAWADGHARSLDASVAEARAILAAMAMSA